MNRTRINLTVEPSTKYLLKKYIPNVGRFVDSVAEESVKKDKNFNERYKELLKRAEEYGLISCKFCKEKHSADKILFLIPKINKIKKFLGDLMEFELYDPFVGVCCSNCIDKPFNDLLEMDNNDQEKISLFQIITHDDLFNIVTLQDFICKVITEEVKETLMKQAKIKAGRLDLNE